MSQTNSNGKSIKAIGANGDNTKGDTFLVPSKYVFVTMIEDGGRGLMPDPGKQFTKTSAPMRRQPEEKAQTLNRINNANAFLGAIIYGPQLSVGVFYRGKCNYEYSKQWRRHSATMVPAIPKFTQGSVEVNPNGGFSFVNRMLDGYRLELQCGCWNLGLQFAADSGRHPGCMRLLGHLGHLRRRREIWDSPRCPIGRSCPIASGILSA